VAGLNFCSSPVPPHPRSYFPSSEAVCQLILVTMYSCPLTSCSALIHSRLLKKALMFLEVEFGILRLLGGSPDFARGPAGPPERQGLEQRRGPRARAGGHADWLEARNRIGTTAPARGATRNSASGQSVSPLVRESEGLRACVI
jgi:hypothetical protein